MEKAAVTQGIYRARDCWPESHPAPDGGYAGDHAEKGTHAGKIGDGATAGSDLDHTSPATQSINR